MTRSSVYLYGYYGQGNLGDDLLLQASVAMIRSIRPPVTILVHCRDPARLPPLHDPAASPVPAAAVLADRSLPRVQRLIRHFAMLRIAFAQCDALVFGGGTVLQESRSPVSILLIAAMVELARRQGLRVILIGAGLGEPRSAPGRMAMTRILRHADIACLRDSRSLAIARGLAPGARLAETSDLVFSLAGEADFSAPRPGDALALSIQPSITGRNDATGEKARRLLADLAGRAVRSGKRVKLLVFETKMADDEGVDDRAAWRALVGPLLDDPASGVTLATADADAPMRLYDGVSLHAGMRFHGHVLAALAGLPFVGLSHDVKIAEICRAFAMPCHDVGEASQNDVWAALAAAAGSAVSPAVMGELRALASRNRDSLAAGLA
jgi:polysaccharide pyruvyl transferase WcaK-like protein